MSVPTGMTVDQLQLQATRCLREGRVPDGIRAYEQLLALRPAHADSWYNLAYLQRCDRRFEASLASYQKALDLGISRPEEIHLNRAVILSEHLERAEAAKDELGKALALNPGFVTAWLNLGTLHEDSGDREQAKAAYDEVLKLAPTNGRALARLATIDSFGGRAGEWVPKLRQALAVPGLGKADAAEIGFALGQVLDATAAYDDAFAAYEAANRASLQSRAPTDRGYDPQAQEKLVDAIIRTFPLASVAGNDDGRAPIFICGMFRSGSTLAEQLLARHSRVTPGGELEFIPALVQHRLQPYPASLAGRPSSTLDDLQRTYLQELDAIHPGSDVVTDKRPDNFLHIGLIKAMFPQAKIVHTKRNALDNILSVYFLNFEHSISYGFDLKQITHWYLQYHRLMSHWRSVYPDDIYDLDYDEVVRKPQQAIAGLLDFCGLPWEEACLSPGTTGTLVRTASVWQVRQPLHDRSSGRWRNYATYIADVRQALAGILPG